MNTPPLYLSPEFLHGLFNNEFIAVKFDDNTPIWPTLRLNVSTSPEGQTSMTLLVDSALAPDNRLSSSRRDEIHVTQEIFGKFVCTGKLPKYSADLRGLKLDPRKKGE